MNKPLFLRRVLTVLCAIPLVCAHAQTNPTPQDSDLQSISNLGSELFRQSGSTGMVLVVVRGHQVLFQGYGETAPNSHQLPAQDSLLRLCSLTKIFTSDLLQKSVAAKTLRLDDPLQRFAPSGRVVPQRDGPITLLSLATHTSGLPRELGNLPAQSAHFTFPDFDTRWRWLPNQRLRSAPGKAALYSNVAYDFLSDALAAATQEQYARLLAEHTLHPLHMWNTTFFPTLKQCSQLLSGVHDERPCTYTEATAGSSGLYSTASDMTIWLQYLLGTSTPQIPAQDPSAQAVFLLPSTLASQKGLDRAGEPTGIGLGWIHILPLDSPSHIVEKTGGGAGFETYIALNHARQTALFLAATDGPVDTHLNIFDAANNLLLAVSGLPPLAEPKPPLRHRHRRLHRQTRPL